jgi:hypothetical protein
VGYRINKKINKRLKSKHILSLYGIYINIVILKEIKSMERLEMVKEILKRVNTDPIFNQRAEETLEEAGITREEYMRYVDIAKKIYESEK